jgi:hypothetical protein
MPLIAALQGADDLGVVVRAHLHIEHELQELIFFAAPNPAQLKKLENMQFSEKVWLALVLGMNAELKPALSAAATLRNRFSHRLDMKLTNEDAKDLIAKMTSDTKQQVLNFRRMFQPSNSKMEPANALSVRDRIQVFFVATFIEVARERHRLALERFAIVSRR